MKKILLITLIFTILGCSKDDDTGSPEAIFCNCTERVTVRDLITGTSQQTSFREFSGECNQSGTKRNLDPGERFETTIITRCVRP